MTWRTLTTVRLVVIAALGAVAMLHGMTWVQQGHATNLAMFVFLCGMLAYYIDFVANEICTDGVSEDK